MQQTLQQIVELAVATIEACDHAGISLIVDGRIETPAQNDEIPALIDGIQLASDEGPDRDAVRAHEVFVTADLAGEQQWSRFSREVHERTGVRSMLSVRLVHGEEPLGSLNLYADERDAFGEKARHVASIFASHIAIALRSAQQLQRLTEATASDDVDTVSQAKGLIMVHEEVDEVAALQKLTDVSLEHGISLREAAERFVERETRRRG